MTSFTRRHALGAGGALGLAAALAACGSDTGGGDGGTPELTDEGNDLTVWFMKDSVSEKAMDWLKSAYEEKTGGTLTYEIQVWEGIVSKLQTSLASTSSTPDIIELGNTQAPTFCAVGALLNLDDLEEDLGGDSLTQSLVELGSFDGSLYAAPFYAGSRVFFYRKDWFEELGLEVPTTIEQLTSVATTLHEANPGGNADFSGLWLPGIGAQQCYAWLFTNGGRIATEADGKWAADLSSEESQAAFAQVQEIWSKASRAGSVTDPTTGGELHVPFNAEEAGMIFGFNWQYKSIDDKLKDKVGFFGFPGVEEGGTGHPFAGGSNVAISASSQKQTAAVEALKLIFAKEFQEFFATEGGWVPGNIDHASALGDDDLATLTAQAVENSVGTPAAANWALVEGARTLDDFFVALAGGGDPVSLATTADASITDMLNKS
ncbi:extracellular solute-binding protein [Brachybacterium sp. NBEC-018]|uniref:extracellular solute-binding protein n=1 Tax=Brachybacterium sp. NBEC-018 TaxID=2996004 RepID=UPI0021756D2F|nr:extracellular solute-binding protein [Brachybacterium sp. NBEC-018]UVY84464.1 extracellular solute-binding protein [Brachybacterium sp. NBEC-018]